jgi:hypothetical protein
MSPPIERVDGTLICTGDAIRWYRLKVVIGAIKLEQKGIRFRQRVKCGWARRLGLPSRAKAEEVIEALEAEIKKLEQRGL